MMTNTNNKEKNTMLVAKIKNEKKSSSKQKDYAYDLLARANEAYVRCVKIGYKEEADFRFRKYQRSIDSKGGSVAAAVIDTLKDEDARSISREIAARIRHRGAGKAAAEEFKTKFDGLEE